VPFGAASRGEPASVLDAICTTNGSADSGCRSVRSRVGRRWHARPAGARWQPRPAGVLRPFGGFAVRFGSGGVLRSPNPRGLFPVSSLELIEPVGNDAHPCVADRAALHEELWVDGAGISLVLDGVGF
jgi:hypothetical protein